MLRRDAQVVDEDRVHAGSARSECARIGRDSNASSPFNATNRACRRSLIVVGAYLIGSISFAVVVCERSDCRIRTSTARGNPGATNVLRTGNKQAALLTLLGDGLKGFVAVFAAQRCSRRASQLPEWTVAGGGARRVRRPPAIRCSTASAAARAWRPARASCSRCTGRSASLLAVVWLTMAFGFKISSLAGLTVAALMPLGMFYVVRHRRRSRGRCVPIALLLFWRHRENIRQLVSGRERTIGGERSVGDGVRIAARRPATRAPTAAAPRTRRRRSSRASAAARRRARSSRRCRCRTRGRESRRSPPRFATSSHEPLAQLAIRADAARDDQRAAARSRRAPRAPSRRARRRPPPGTRARCRPRAWSASDASPPSLRASVSTAVFSPEKLMSRSPESSIGRGSDTAPRAARLGQLRERRSARIGQAEQLRGLVERLAGGVVERVAEQPVVARRPSTSNSWLWPPDTSSATNGNAGRGSASSGDSRWPSR